MDKGIGFNRNIKLDWLDATAAFCAETDDPAEIRARLQQILAQDRTGKEAIRKSIDVLLHIWHKSQETIPDLRQQAIHIFQTTAVPGDRLWLHYGLTIVAYPFFWQCASTIGQLIRFEDTINNRVIVKHMTAELGELGSLERAVRRVLSSLRDWNILTNSDKQHAYLPRYHALSASTLELEAWLLACVLKAHPGEELPFPDLVNHPALFPFHFTTTAGQLRDHAAFAVHRQGLGLDMVRAAPPEIGD